VVHPFASLGEEGCNSAGWVGWFKQLQRALPNLEACHANLLVLDFLDETRLKTERCLLSFQGFIKIRNSYSNMVQALDQLPHREAS
jgi:hypothetical protein